MTIDRLFNGKGTHLHHINRTCSENLYEQKNIRYHHFPKEVIGGVEAEYSCQNATRTPHSTTHGYAHRMSEKEKEALKNSKWLTDKTKFLDVDRY